MKQLFAVTLFFSALFGQTDVSLKNLTLEEAIDRVKQSNLELSIAAYERASKNQAVDAARSHRFGSLDLVQNVMQSNDAGNVFGFKLASREASFTDFGFDSAAMQAMNNGNFAYQPEGLNYPKEATFYQTKLTYALPLYTGGKISGGVDIAQSMEKLSTLDHEALKREKVYQVTKSFYDIALLESFIANLTTIHDNIQSIEKMTLTMVKEGYAKQIDTLQVESKKASVARYLEQSKANKTLALQFLSFLLNTQVDSITAPAVDNTSAVPAQIDIESLLLTQKAQTGVAIMESMVSIMRADYLPMVGAFAELSSADNTFGGDFEDHHAYTVGMQLKWNLFDGLGTSSRVEEAKIGHLKAKAQFELAKKGLRLQILKLQTEIASLAAEIKSLDAQIALETKIVENYRNRYAEKLISINDVMMAESNRLTKVLELQEIANNKNDKTLQLHMLTKGN